jgi:hypothetical protein
MYLIALFGALMAGLSIVMVVNPEYWSRGIVKISEKPYFHPFEVLTRFLFGVIFVGYADQTLYPTMNSIIGYVLLLVSIGLLLTPPSIHRQFAVWSAQKFRQTFRPAGVASFGFGLFIVYTALGGTGL